MNKVKLFEEYINERISPVDMNQVVHLLEFLNYDQNIEKLEKEFDKATIKEIKKALDNIKKIEKEV